MYKKSFIKKKYEKHKLTLKCERIQYSYPRNQFYYDENVCINGTNKLLPLKTLNNIFFKKINPKLPCRERSCESGLPGPEKLKRPNLAKSSFKKAKFSKMKKRPNKGQIVFKNLFKKTSFNVRIL